MGVPVVDPQEKGAVRLTDSTQGDVGGLVGAALSPCDIPPVVHLVAPLDLDVEALEDVDTQNDQWKVRSEEHHAKGSEKAKHPNTPHKEMVEYLKKHKPKK